MSKGKSQLIEILKTIIMVQYLILEKKKKGLMIESC